MEDKIIKVLQIGATDNLGGIEIYLKNYYDNIDKNKLHFDFINMYNEICFQKHYEENKSKVFKILSYRKNPIKYIKTLKEILIKEKYDILHFNMNSAVFLQPLIAAKLAKTKVIIAHSHNSYSDKGILKDILHNFMKMFIPFFANTFFACSDYAGKWFFNDKIIKKDDYYIIKNGINTNKFIFDIDMRNKKRKELNLKDTDIVIGHVGRFNKQKNHKYLIEVFKNIYSKNRNLKLFLVGEGPLKDEVKKMIIDNNLENSIIMLGKRQDMNELYQAFDGFVLPSLYEGLPLVGVEAQIAGCRCILSDSITKEVQIRDDVKFISLKDIDLWEKEILNITNDISERKMKDKNKYDIKLNAEELLNIYRIQLTKEK